MASINGSGNWSDIIEDFMDYTANAVSPSIHRLWSGISLVGGACERRVWTTVGDYVDFPNLYILLVAPPGTGKSIINVVKELWREVKKPMGSLPGSLPGGKGALHVASDSLTRASFIDELSGSTSTHLINGSPLKPYVYNSLLVAAEEFEVLLPYYDSAFISALNDLWNAKSEHVEKRRHGPAKEVTIERPHLCILGGAQPSYFVAHFPEQAWETGLARRIIMVYADSSPRRKPFSKTPNKDALRDKILKRLGLISEMYQEVRIGLSMQERLTKWVDDEEPPKPGHSRLKGYSTTRFEFIIKLSLISCISRSGGSDMVIEEFDVNRAFKWLLEAEHYMPDIFHAMVGRSDNQVMEELHRHIMSIWIKTKQPIKTSIIIEFLGERLPSEKVNRVFQVAEQSGKIARAPNTVDSWLPRVSLRVIDGG